jgi:hypothetical protein
MCGVPVAVLKALVILIVSYKLLHSLCYLLSQTPAPTKLAASETDKAGMYLTFALFFEMGRQTVQRKFQSAQVSEQP